MRCSLLILTGALALAGCSDSTLSPVQVVDGTWKGTQNGFALSLAMTETGTTVSTCTANFGTSGDLAPGTCSGTFVYPTLNVTISVTGFQPIQYQAVMSSTEATLDGMLNGPGVDHVSMTIRKQ